MFSFALTENSNFPIAIPNNAGTLAFYVKGVTASDGAVLTPQASLDGGQTYFDIPIYSILGSAVADTVAADGPYSVNVAGFTTIRLLVTSAGTGTAQLTYNISNQFSGITSSSGGGGGGGDVNVAEWNGAAPGAGNPMYTIIISPSGNQAIVEPGNTTPGAGDAALNVVLSPNGAPQKPYVYTPIGTSQYGVALTAAEGLTVPEGANYAQITIETGNVRWTDDGTTPTATEGHLWYPGNYFVSENLAALKFIQQSSGTPATMSVSYLK
jgi:hypothetical protein